MSNQYQDGARLIIKPMTTARKLFYYNGGFLHQKQLRRIMSLAGYKLTLGLPSPGDLVAVWGQSPNQYRGQWMAKKRQVGLLRVEDAFLRSVQPGRAGDPPLGLILDRSGCHFDASHPFELENILRYDPLDDANLLRLAEQAIVRIRHNHCLGEILLNQGFPIFMTSPTFRLLERCGGAIANFGVTKYCIGAA